MTTLIVVSNSDGVVGRCDAKCYDAVHDKCDCVCGGRNHGVGYGKAAKQTAEWFSEGAESVQFSSGEGLVVYAPVFQIPLF